MHKPKLGERESKRKGVGSPLILRNRFPENDLPRTKKFVG
jgi:hypothetical protein